MKKLILHIGSGKCGSSSLQSYLGSYFSQPRGRINRNGETVAYAAIYTENVLMAEQLLEEQQKAAKGYISSVRLSQIQPDSLRKSLIQLKKQCKSSDIVVLSCEGWRHEAAQENASMFLELDVPIELVMVTRPPIELMNAAWWQWGAWTGLPVETWCLAQSHLANFQMSLDAWNDTLLGPNVRVIELSQGPVQEFLRFLGFQPDDLPKASFKNVATNSHLLRHLIKNKSLYGRSVHAPEIEFRLNESLQLTSDRPPMIIPNEITRHILETVLISSKKIIEAASRQGKPISQDIQAKYLNIDYYLTYPRIDFNKWLEEDPTDKFLQDVFSSFLRVEQSLRLSEEKLKQANRNFGSTIYSFLRRLL